MDAHTPAWVYTDVAPNGALAPAGAGRHAFEMDGARLADMIERMMMSPEMGPRNGLVLATVAHRLRVEAKAAQRDDLAVIPERFTDAPRAASHGGFVHTCSDRPSGLPFGRKAPETCARCWELVNGAEPRADHAAGRRGGIDADRRAEMAAHFADPQHDAKCGPVCTAFDW